MTDNSRAALEQWWVRHGCHLTNASTGAPLDDLFELFDERDAEIERLNTHCDKYEDAMLKERRLAEERIAEMGAEIERLRDQLACQVSGDAVLIGDSEQRATDAEREIERLRGVCDGLLRPALEEMEQRAVDAERAAAVWEQGYDAMRVRYARRVQECMGMARDQLRLEEEITGLGRDEAEDQLAEAVKMLRGIVDMAGVELVDRQLWDAIRAARDLLKRIEGGGP